MHHTWLLLSIVTFVGCGAPVGLLIGSRRNTAPLGAPTPSNERLRRARINAKVRPTAKVALAMLAALFVVFVCLTIATAGT